MKRMILVLSLGGFLVLTGVTLGHQDYPSIFLNQLTSPGGIQVLVDLVIALTLFLVWMWQDAKAAKRNPWPWMALTLATGSIGPLVYLLVHKTGSKADVR